MSFPSKPEHGVGNQELTFRMAANAIEYKVGIVLQSIQFNQLKQAEIVLNEIRALADSIVHNENSGQ
jgi:hypothetical protein